MDWENGARRLGLIGAPTSERNPNPASRTALGGRRSSQTPRKRQLVLVDDESEDETCFGYMQAKADGRERGPATHAAAQPNTNTSLNLTLTLVPSPPAAILIEKSSRKLADRMSRRLSRMRKLNPRQVPRFRLQTPQDSVPFRAGWDTEPSWLFAGSLSLSEILRTSPTASSATKSAESAKPTPSYLMRL
ncbi:hypothetical protein C8034_v012406 [Colletotrichum sidae]|uniref:Uncharacterized protein n=1 Tax=Colletotrichum sidae TaxID=1347389 RepID=A0A4R8T007_9PEZI|nr:hypothetical protein C8034_v012406 [Colletotrichum sidae]